jgi:hypothetical protein
LIHFLEVVLIFKSSVVLSLVESVEKKCGMYTLKQLALVGESRVTARLKFSFSPRVETPRLGSRMAPFSSALRFHAFPRSLLSSSCKDEQHTPNRFPLPQGHLSLGLNVSCRSFLVKVLLKRSCLLAEKHLCCAIRSSVPLYLSGPSPSSGGPLGVGSEAPFGSLLPLLFREKLVQTRYSTVPITNRGRDSLCSRRTAASKHIHTTRRTQRRTQRLIRRRCFRARISAASSISSTSITIATNTRLKQLG